MKEFICKAVCLITFNTVALKWCKDKCCGKNDDCLTKKN